MALPAIAYAAVVITLAAAGAYSIYQIRLSITEVKEVFISDSSFLNKTSGQIVVGGIAAYLIFNYFKR